MYTKLIIIGRLVDNPAAQNTKSTTTVVKGTVVSNRKYKGEEQTTFIQYVAFGATAEILLKYAEKGQAITLDGRLAQEHWEKDGKKHSKHVMMVDNVVLIPTSSQSQPDKKVYATKRGYSTDIDDDIPF